MASTLQKIKTAVTGDKSERLAARREIKTKLAGIEATRQRIEAISEQIRTLNDRIESATEAHRVTCEPLQAELAAIDEKIADKILAGRAVPAGLPESRAAALEKIATANAALEAELAVVKKLIRDREIERKQLAPSTNEISELRGRLASAELANPELLKAKFVASQRHLAALDRQRRAQRELQGSEERLLARQQNREAYYAADGERDEDGGYRNRPEHEDPEREKRDAAARRDVTNWAAELEAATAEVAAATSAREAANKAVIDE